MKRSSEGASDSMDVSPPKLVKRVKEYGVSGQIVALRANYFEMEKSYNFSLGQYRLDFEPDTEVTNTRKDIVRINKELLDLKMYTFDGSSLYTASVLNEAVIEAKYNEKPMKITIRRTGTIKSDDSQSFQIFNLILRDCMAKLKLQNIKRNYYDPLMRIEVKEGNLQLWPGYLTSIRGYEEDRVLLSVEVIHKFMRNETIYDIASNLMKDRRSGHDWQEILKREVVGSTVLTDYTNKTYMIDDIDFKKNPMSTFNQRGEELSYFDYYKSKYNITLKDKNQFMLVSRARERDIRAGQPELIYLIPELSRATGLTDRMRQDFKLMQAISAYTRLSPDQRVDSLNRFNQRMQGTKESMQILEDWNMKLNKTLVDVKGRELPQEQILFGNGHEEAPSAKAEWNMRNGVVMYKTVDCTRWIFLYPRELEKESLNFEKALIEACGKMKYQITPPLHRAIYDDRQESYIKEIDEIAGKKPKLILVALPTNRADRYSSIKRRCMVDYGIPCQVIVKNKTMNHRNINSIASKIAIQINCKLGGMPWMIKLPVKGLMVIGFDVSHHPRDRSRSVGALVATMDLNKSSVFYSITMEYKDGNEMVQGLDKYLHSALKKYEKICDALPERIVFYRDGVGEGQLPTVNAQEVQPIIKTLEKVYAKVGKQARFAYIIVNKRTNARFFKRDDSRFSNPVPGTVIDRVVTMGDRSDFYLVSQKVGQGTVAPTYYQVVHNTSELNMDKLQILTFKLCHLYFNWGGTVRIPCVSQFAKKLAFLTSQSLQQRVHEDLEETLYYL